MNTEELRKKFSNPHWITHKTIHDLCSHVESLERKLRIVNHISQQVIQMRRKHKLREVA